MRVQNIHVLGVESQAFPAQVPAVFPDHSFPSRGGSPFFYMTLLGTVMGTQRVEIFPAMLIVL